MKTETDSWRIRLNKKLETISDRWFDRAMEGSGKLVDKTIKTFTRKNDRDDHQK